jgi:hypothetical protein
MKRAHRRLHLLLWPVVFGVGAFGLLMALRNLPADPVGDIPAAAMTNGDR